MYYIDLDMTYHDKKNVIQTRTTINDMYSFGQILFYYYKIDQLFIAKDYIEKYEQSLIFIFYY